jgi:hypothetical protein
MGEAIAENLIAAALATPPDVNAIALVARLVEDLDPVIEASRHCDEGE